MIRDLHSWLALRIVARAEERRRERRAAFLRSSSRETIASLLVGTVAATLGLVVLFAAQAGLAASPNGDWHIEAKVSSETYEDLCDPERGTNVRCVVKNPVMTIYLSSGWCLAIGCIGLLLSASGHSRRRVSPLRLMSAITIVLALGVPYLCFFAFQLYFWLLDACT
jgi:hypothetical protein